MCSVVQPPPIKIQTFALFSSIKSSAFLMVIDGIIVTRIDGNVDDNDDDAAAEST